MALNEYYLKNIHTEAEKIIFNILCNRNSSLPYIGVVDYKVLFISRIMKIDKNF